MPLPEDIQERISEFRDLFMEYERDMKDSIEEEDDDTYRSIRDNEFMEVFHEICELVEEAESSNPSYLFELLNAAQQVLAEGTRIACAGGDDQGLHPMIPSWAHNDQNDRPLIPDRSDPLPPIPLSALAKFLPILGIHGREAKQKMKELRKPPWDASTQRHPLSTRLARFRPNLPPALTATPSEPIALSVLDARCEITSTGVSLPAALHLTENNSCLFSLGASGYKNRSPSVRCSFLDENSGSLSGRAFQPGLADLAAHIAVDETQCLIFVGDSDRVKSYLWGNPDGTYYDHFIPVHTLKSEEYSGPIAVLPDRSILRAGSGRAAIWNEPIETHGDEGKQIGPSINVEETWRDDPQRIEPSSGSLPTSVIKFVDDPTLKPSIWKQLIDLPSTIICNQDTWESTNYTCVTIDFEAGGKTVGRYLGHAGAMTEISVSAVDPRMFLTGCSDGYARLYDTRRALPALTFDACGQGDSCEGVALAYPDGIPIVFTGTGKQENIKVWDVRARAAVYELSTGNNSVESLAWDSRRNCLYAATQCYYVDRMGYHQDYRHARIRNPAKGQNSDEARATDTGEHAEVDDNMDEDQEDEGQEDEVSDSDDSFIDDPRRFWPDRAQHPEDWFGYMLDAGNHRIFRYAFKEDPNPRKLPGYGSGRPDYRPW